MGAGKTHPQATHYLVKIRGFGSSSFHLFATNRYEKKIRDEKLIYSGCFLINEKHGNCKYA